MSNPRSIEAVGGQLTDVATSASVSSQQAAQQGFSWLMAHVIRLYTHNEASSISDAEALQLTQSVLYVLAHGAGVPTASNAGPTVDASTSPVNRGVQAGQIASENVPLNQNQLTELLARSAQGGPQAVIDLWTTRRTHLQNQLPQVMTVWQKCLATTPRIHNIALRDTLSSIGRLPQTYDTFFNAHQIPCDIDYPLSAPVPETLQGLDYIHAWLSQLLAEARFLARFDPTHLEAYLDSWCPDYRGLLINLYDPVYEAWRSGLLRPVTP